MTENEVTYEKPLKQDLQMKYYAESFSVKPDVEWKGEWKKDFISEYSFQTKQYNNEWDKYEPINEKALDIHKELLETNETYKEYYRLFCLRNTERVETPVQSAAYLDRLIEEKILTVNLNDTGKLILKTRKGIAESLMYSVMKDINNEEYTINSRLGYLNRKPLENKGYGEIEDITREDFKTYKDMSFNMERIRSYFMEITESEGKIDVLKSMSYNIKQYLSDIF